MEPIELKVLLVYVCVAAGLIPCGAVNASPISARVAFKDLWVFPLYHKHPF